MMDDKHWSAIRRAGCLLYRSRQNVRSATAFKSSIADRRHQLSVLMTAVHIIKEASASLITRHSPHGVGQVISNDQRAFGVDRYADRPATGLAILATKARREVQRFT